VEILKNSICDNDYSCAFAYEGSNLSIEITVMEEFFNNNDLSLSDEDIAANILKYVIQRDGIFIAGDIKVILTPRNQKNEKLIFNVTFPFLEKPKLDLNSIIEELRNSISHDDEDLDDYETRLIAIVETKIKYPLPHQYLSSKKDPIEAISIWKSAIVMSAIADIELPIATRENAREEKARKVIEWIKSQLVY